MSRPIFLAADGNYRMQLATCLRSIVESNRAGWPLDFHVLMYDFPEDARVQVNDSLPAGAASIRWIPIDVEQFREFWTAEHMSVMTFARLLVPAALPNHASKVLYLDSDLIVLGDLSSLWESDLNGKPVGAVLDSIDGRLQANAPEFEHVPRVGAYFNAGVLLIDLERWRAEKISEQALDYLQKHPMLPYCDQDAINVTCDGRWARLHPRWNYQDHLEETIEELPKDQWPGVVHFCTRLKPWKPGCLHPQAPLYDDFRRRTRFARGTASVASDYLEETWWRVKRFLRGFAVMRAVRDLVTASKKASQ
jgi:lipopolysaccharide biosynthesis glycosyltransferase